MRGKVAIALAVACGTTTAHANDKPAIAPIPAWVKPHPLPADDGKRDEAAVRLLLNDQQARFAPDGVTSYAEVAMRIQTPQGLAAGNISLPWNPELDTLTIHRFRVIRGGKDIDVLATQSFTVLRREVNLERATLDGVLTATLQPEGLQVGDVIDLALSLKHHDPALGNHVEHLFVFDPNVPTQAAALATQWPATMPLHWRERSGLPAVAERDAAGGTREAGFAPEPLAAVTLPRGAPLRYAMVRQVEFSDWTDWTAAAATLAPVYERAATLRPDGALKAEAARIAAASADPKVRAAAALALVEQQVRYVAIMLNDGGMVPAAADLSWERRYGDCKGKTVMLIGLLRALGIDAVPVLVSSSQGDGLDRRLPMLGLFDHVLVRATIAGRTYWLDGTRQGDRDLDAIETPPFHWGLPLVPAGAALVPIAPVAATRPFSTVSLTLDARAGIGKPAVAHAVSQVRGDLATGLRLALGNLSPEQRDAAMREYWHNLAAVLTPTTVAASFDEGTGEETLTLDGTATMDWGGGGYETDGTGIGYAADFTRPAGPDRDAPWAVPFPTSERWTETILLPDHGRGYSLDDPAFDRTIAGIRYTRTGSLSDGTVRIERLVRSVAPEFPNSEAAAAQATLTALGRKAVYVRPPGVAARGSLALALPQAASSPLQATASPPTSDVEAAARTASRLFAAGRFADAAAAYSTLIDAHPESALAHAARAATEERLGNDAAARADLDRAVELAPRDLDFLDARGHFALSHADRDQAIADAATMRAVTPDDARGYRLQGQVHVAERAWDKAAAEAEQAIAHAPADVDSYLLLANALRSGGKPEQALVVAGRLTAANPTSDYAFVVAGAIEARLSHPAEAARDFDRAIALKPTASAYLTRAQYRPLADLAGRQADVDAARKLEPGNPGVLEMQAALDQQGKHYDQAVTDLTALLRQEPGDRSALAGRGIAYARLGRDNLARADFAAARGAGQDTAMLNQLCWRKAVANVALPSALADCDAALTATPDQPNVMDSRALVLVRMKRWDEAIALYDRVLARQPKLATSLYGRSLAKAGRGDAAGAATDRQAALQADPLVADEIDG